MKCKRGDKQSKVGDNIESFFELLMIKPESVLRVCGHNTVIVIVGKGKQPQNVGVESI